MTPRGRRRAPTDPTIAVAYLRVSTEDQSLGPEAQRAAITRWATTNGVRVVAVYEDLGVSGGTSIEDRPGLLAAVDALRQHGAGLLVVAKRDRLARDVIICAMIERLAQRVGAKVVSADGTGNGDGPEAALMRSIIDAFGAYERALIRSRTKSALAVKRARGERTSRFAPYGYLIGPDGKMLVALPAEQEVVTRIRVMHATGLSFSEIARRLGSDGARGTRWFASSVAAIVRAPRTGG